MRLLAFVVKHYTPLLYLHRKSLAIYGIISAMPRRYPSKNLFFSEQHASKNKAAHAVLLFWLAAS
jgi:hypothetical protein